MDLSFEFKQIRSELTKIVELLQSSDANSETMKMYDIVDLQDLLKVSRRTIATWTKEGTLPHTKKGNKIWVTEEQLKSFLEQNSNNTNENLKIREGGRYDERK